MSNTYRTIGLLLADGLFYMIIGGLTFLLAQIPAGIIFAGHPLSAAAYDRLDTLFAAPCLCFWGFLVGRWAQRATDWGALAGVAVTLAAEAWGVGITLLLWLYFRGLFHVHVGFGPDSSWRDTPSSALWFLGPFLGALHEARTHRREAPAPPRHPPLRPRRPRRIPQPRHGFSSSRPARLRRPS